MADKGGCQNGPDDAKIMFRDMKFEDLFHDADMPALLTYLRGNKHLRIPSEWRPYLPTRLD
jgi:hypothetical protein